MRIWPSDLWCQPMNKHPPTALQAPTIFGKIVTNSRSLFGSWLKSFWQIALLCHSNSAQKSSRHQTCADKSSLTDYQSQFCFRLLGVGLPKGTEEAIDDQSHCPAAHGSRAWASTLTLIVLFPCVLGLPELIWPCCNSWTNLTIRSAVTPATSCCLKSQLPISMLLITNQSDTICPSVCRTLTWNSISRVRLLFETLP